MVILTMYIVYTVRVCGVPWSLSAKETEPSGMAVPNGYDCFRHAIDAGVD